MDNWVDMLRSHYNWNLRDRLDQYFMHYAEGSYCDLRTKAEMTPLTCCVSRYGATGEPWVENPKPKLSKETGELIEVKAKVRSAGDIQIVALPELKKARPWFADIDSTVLQQNVRRLDVAYKNFFEGAGFPQFKNRSNFTSFSYTVGVKLQGNRIYLPKLGWMKMHLSRSIPSGFTIKAATVRKRQDGWLVSLRIEDKSVPSFSPKPYTEVSKTVGLDMGLTKLVHVSDGQQFDNPRFLGNKKTRRQLNIRQRRVSRKHKGSKNRKKAALLVGKLHLKIKNKREAYQWEIANKIASRKVDAIAIEDLNISGMMRRCRVKFDSELERFLPNGQARKVGLNRSIADASWGDLILKIEYLAAKQGKVVIKVPPKFSSQECPECHHIEAANRDKEKFICIACGFIAHADIKAARTIRDRAEEIVQQIRTGGLSETAGISSRKRPRRQRSKTEVNHNRVSQGTVEDSNIQTDISLSVS